MDDEALEVEPVAFFGPLLYLEVELLFLVVELLVWLVVGVFAVLL